MLLGLSSAIRGEDVTRRWMAREVGMAETQDRLNFRP
jgi:hypothetical protein